MTNSLFGSNLAGQTEHPSPLQEFLKLYIGTLSLYVMQLYLFLVSVSGIIQTQA